MLYNNIQEKPYVVILTLLRLVWCFSHYDDLVDYLLTKTYCFLTYYMAVYIGHGFWKHVDEKYAVHIAHRLHGLF
jgi:hypothetical protein